VVLVLETTVWQKKKKKKKKESSSSLKAFPAFVTGQASYAETITSVNTHYEENECLTA